MKDKAGKTELPVVLPVDKIVDEGADTRTFVFRQRLGAKPGQFVMLWLPRVDEKPFSVSYQDNERFAVTVMAVGPFSRKMMGLKPGDKVGIRGPYGRPYTIRGSSLVIVGGGCGCAPTAFLADTARRMDKKVDFVIGARTGEALLFVERMKRSGIRTHIATDDGTAGRKGYATDVLRDLLEKQKVGSVYTCGPEVMMKIVVDMCLKKRIYCEASLERYMKCGFGVCGQCCLDSTGLRVCKEGPVFTGRQLSKIKEFGSHRRDATGRKVRL